jgi:hypothetical protein
VATQAQRAQGYRNYTTTLAPHPALVGFHWFQWVDQPVAGRESDGENSNFGLVNKDGTSVKMMKLLKRWSVVSPATDCIVADVALCACRCDLH